jgi:hypothetical protein
MPNEASQELAALKDELRRLGAALGLSVRMDETTVGFAQRCQRAARALKAGAGVTWRDYELIGAVKGTATFALKDGADVTITGGPRWRIQVNEGLDVLAERLGMYEEAATT